MAGRRGEEVALLRRLLLGREGGVVGGDMGERAVRQRLPQRRAVGLVRTGGLIRAQTPARATSSSVKER
jgi:hypothetical protein